EQLPERLAGRRGAQRPAGIRDERLREPVLRDARERGVQRGFVAEVEATHGGQDHVLERRGERARRNARPGVFDRALGDADGASIGGELEQREEAAILARVRPHDLAVVGQLVEVQRPLGKPHACYSAAMDLVAERVVASGDALGECPIWDERMAALWWVDIHGRALKRYDGESVKVVPLPEPPGSIALRRDGGLIVALASGVYLIGTTEPELLVRPAEHEAGLRFNDGRCDRNGRFWVGTLAEPDFPPRGLLYRVEPDGRATPMRRGIQVPNSIAFSPD